MESGHPVRIFKRTHGQPESEDSTESGTAEPGVTPEGGGVGDGATSEQAGTVEVTWDPKRTGEVIGTYG